MAQATKTGHVYVFDRETGAPLFPMEEQPVPPSDLEGEVAAATQPVPKAPPAFSRQLFSEDQITDLSPEATASVRERWLAAKRGSTWAPPSTQGTIIFPGFDGGAEWGGSAYDERSGLFYVNANEMPWILRLVKLGKPGEGGEPAGRRTYQAFCGTCHGENRQGDPLRTVPSLDGVESRLSRSAVAAIIDERARPDAVVQGHPGRGSRGADRLPVPRRADAARRRGRRTIRPTTSSTRTPATTASSIRRATRP